MDFLFYFFLIGYFLSLLTIYFVNKTLVKKEDKIELSFALILSLLGYVLILMIMLDYLDNKFKERIPFIKAKFMLGYTLLNNKFMGLK